MSLISRLYNFVDGTNSSADAVDAEFDAILAFLNTNVVHKDGTVVMTGLLTLSGNPTANLHAATKQYVDGLVTAPAFPGVVCMWGGSAIPVGWLQCNGQAVSRATYAALFAAVSTAFGAGNGTTTFNVPDLTGRVPVGVGIGAGLTGNWTVGLKYGAEDLQAHSHTVPSIYDANYDAHTHSGKSGQLSEGSLSADGWSASNAPTTVAGTGAGLNWQPSLGIYFIIKT